MGLADYKGVIATVASTASFCLLLAPSLLCFKIWKKGSSKDVPFSPILESFARSILILQQGIVLGLFPLIVTHSIGLVLNCSYISTYLYFTQDKTEAKKSMTRWVTFLVPMIAYANYEDKLLVQTRYPNLVTAFTTSLLVLHLYQTKDVFKTKSTKNLPFPILVCAAAVTFLWTLYGIAINNMSLQFQTGVAFCVCVYELSLFAIFPSKPAKPKKKSS